MRSYALFQIMLTDCQYAVDYANVNILLKCCVLIVFAEGLTQLLLVAT